MLNYDPNIFNGIHTVKLTLQQWQYKGHVSVEIGGNTRGHSVIECAMDLYRDDFALNDCEFEFTDDDEDQEGFRCTLKDEEGNELLIEDELNELGRLIVAVEIVDYRKDE